MGRVIGMSVVLFVSLKKEHLERTRLVYELYLICKGQKCSFYDCISHDQEHPLKS